MTDHITIAIDAMGGENSPDKTIEGISYHLKNSDNSFYLIFGNEILINPLIKKYNEYLSNNTLNNFTKDIINHNF